MLDFTPLIDAIADAVLARLTSAPTALTPRLLTVAQAAVYLGRTDKSVQHLAAAGTLPTVKLDGTGAVRCPGSGQGHRVLETIDDMARNPEPAPRFNFGERTPSAQTRDHAGYGRSREGYLMAFERSRTGYSAYSPEVPGCIASARTLHETETLMRRAITFHLRGMRGEGERVQRPRSFVELRRKRLV